MFLSIKTRYFAPLAIMSLLIACADNAATQAAQAPRSPTPAPVEAPVQTSVVADGLEHPWGLEFLPDGRMLVTERPGQLRIVDKDGSISEPLGGVPEVYASGQGGLLDLALSPDFESDRLVYLSYSEPDGDVAGTAVARGKLTRNGLQKVEVIWRQEPKVNSSNHWGSRIVFAPDGTLFITTGDRYDRREDVQDLSTTIGKVIRINADGSIPQGNPFVTREGAQPEIWSYGHRNLQGAALHPETDQLWTLEHGAMGGDELNHPQAGLNYGWPMITYGVDYTGVRIGEGVAKKGMEQPVYFWDPVIAPSGALFYTGDAFPDWRSDLFVGSLAESVLVRLDMQGGRVDSETRFLEDVGERIRDVRQGPDGLIYVITDETDGKIIKIEPAG
ncbi:MAG: PQQ-dependent sugar dehydrogenase [Gammaproteobacteria bacterium]